MVSPMLVQAGLNLHKLNYSYRSYRNAFSAYDKNGSIFADDLEYFQDFRSRPYHALINKSLVLSISHTNQCERLGKTD